MRSAIDILRRGFDSALANWPLLLVRIAESVLFGLMAIGAVIAFLVPLFMSIGLATIDLKNVGDPAEFLAGLLPKYWVFLIYIAVGASVLLIVFVAIHAFVEGGVARVFGDAERAAGVAAVPREQLRFFSMDRWLAGGREAWWPIFLVYNIAWGLAGLVMLVPLLAALVLIVVLRESPAAVVVGCLGLIVSLFVVLILAVVTTVWTQKAITIAVLRVTGAAEALSDAWRETWSDFGRHFGVAFVMFVILIGGSGAISSFSIVAAIPDNAAATIAFTPVRLLLSFVNSVFTAAVGNWFLASFIALTAEGRR